MKAIIKDISEKKLVGMKMETSLLNNKTGILWSQFMPRKKEILNNVSDVMFSLQVYSNNYFEQFNPQNQFIKWALVEVSDFLQIPEEMEAFILEAGKYAVFNYKGSSSDPSIFTYIFSEWLPSSGYFLDQRPHFEVLGAKYKNNDPESEEEIWIPIKS